MLSENCCCVICRPSRGWLICLLFSSPPRGICQRQFSIYPPKKILIPGVSLGGRMDANLKCTAPLKANRSKWSWFAVRKYMINFVECAWPSRIIFVKNRYKRCFESSQIALAFSMCTNFSRNSLEVVQFAIQRWLTCVLHVKSFCLNSKKAKTCLPSQMLFSHQSQEWLLRDHQSHCIHTTKREAKQGNDCAWNAWQQSRWEKKNMSPVDYRDRFPGSIIS